MKSTWIAQSHSEPVSDSSAPFAVDPHGFEDDVLVLVPDADEDQTLVNPLLTARFHVRTFTEIDDLCQAIREPAGTAVLGTGALERKALARLRRALARQPPWSQLPLIVITPSYEGARMESWRRSVLEALGAVTFLQQPVEPRTLRAGVRAALATRRRQYQVRDLLKQQANRTQEISAEMDAFTYSVSHDLRAPLRAIRGFSQAVTEDYGSRLDEAGRDYLVRMAHAADHAEQLIQDLLQYSRLGRAALTLEPVRLDAAVRQALEGLAFEIQAAGASVDVRKPLPQVLAHPPTLQQILACLLSNALKFVAPGVKPRIEVWAASGGRGVRLWVRDNGIGIASAHFQRIFKVFERLHGAETYPGTGMGLAIVAKGAARMGGTAGIDSMLGKGSKFWIELPKP